MRFLIFFLPFMLYSCSSAEEKKSLAGSVQGDPKSTNWDDWKAWPPLDTAALVASMELDESNSVAWFEDATSGIQWQERMDSMEVIATMPACTCPDHDVVDTARFGVEAVYAEPISELVAIPRCAYVGGNRFVLIGQRSVMAYKPERTMGPPWPTCRKSSEGRLVTLS